jgi:hypothetical protein
MPVRTALRSVITHRSWEPAARSGGQTAEPRVVAPRRDLRSHGPIEAGRCYTATYLVNWLFTGLYGYQREDREGRHALVRAYAAGRRPTGIP